MSEYQNTKLFLQKDILQIGQKKFLQSAKVKRQFHRHMLLVISMVKLLENFMKKNYKKQTKKKLRIEKVIKKRN